MICLRQRKLLFFGGQMIVATDVTGIILVFNSAAERMLGYRADGVIGRAVPWLDDYIVKPVEFRQLAQLIEQRLSASRATEKAADEG